MSVCRDFVITNFIVMSQRALLEREGVSFKDLLELEDLGVISAVSSLGLRVTLHSDREDCYARTLYSHGRALLVTHDDPKKELTFGVWPVTSVGCQVLKLGRFAPHEVYLRTVGQELKTGGATVSIAGYRNVSESEVQVFDEELL